MRHKLLVSLELRNVPYTVGNEVEMDEKYTHTIIKGLRLDGVEPQTSWNTCYKKRLSNQQVCIITAIQRSGHTIARTLIMASHHP